MPDLYSLPNFSGAQVVFQDDDVILFRAVDATLGKACWVFRARRPVPESTAFKQLTDAWEATRLRHFRHRHSLAWYSITLDQHQYPVLAFEHCAGQVLATIDRQELGQTQYRCALLQLSRLVQVAQAEAVGSWVLHTAWVFLCGEAQARADSQCQLKVLLLPPVIAQLFTASQPPMVEVDQTTTAQALNRLAVTLFQPAATIAALPPADGNGCQWQQLDRQVLLALGGSIKTAGSNALELALQAHLQSEKLPWRLMDSYSWPSSPWHCAWLYRDDHQTWQQLLITTTPEAKVKSTLGRLQRLAGLPDLFDIQDYWLLPGAKHFWMCLLVPSQIIKPVSESILPLEAADTGRLMAQVCNQLQWLQDSGITLPALTPAQVLVVDNVAKVVPLPIVGPAPAWPREVKSNLAQVAAMAVWLATARAPRWFKGQLQPGARFNALPKPLRSLLQQCLSARVSRRLNLPAMAQVFEDCQYREPVQPSPSKVTVSPKQDERKKVLLFLLLILLFQSLVNAGIIVVFQ